MAASMLRIGELAERTGTNAPTIRYYEAIGLLPPAPRTASGQRAYREDDVRRLVFIRRCRDFGFPIGQVKRLVSLGRDRERSCLEARDLAHAHLMEVREKLDELHRLERSMAALVESCERSCAGGPGADCVMLDDLGEDGTGVSPAAPPPPRSAPAERPCPRPGPDGASSPGDGSGP